MLLSVFSKLEEISEDFKDMLTKDENSRYLIVIIFVALILLFIFGFNAVHKNDK